MPKCLAILLLCFQISCTGPVSKVPTKAARTFPIQPLVIKDSTEDGWGADLRLSITQITPSDTGITYRAISGYNGQDLGLTVFVPNKSEGDKGFASGIILKNIGKESDALLQLFYKLYHLDSGSHAKFITSLSVSYVNLKTFARTVTGKDSEPVNSRREYKLFFEGRHQEEEGEIFLNINEEGHWLELAEKDLEFRKGVVKALSL